MGRVKKTAKEMRVLRARIGRVIAALSERDPEGLEGWLVGGERQLRPPKNVKIKFHSTNR